MPGPRPWYVGHEYVLRDSRIFRGCTRRDYRSCIQDEGHAAENSITRSAASRIFTARRTNTEGDRTSTHDLAYQRRSCRLRVKLEQATPRDGLYEACCTTWGPWRPAYFLPGGQYACRAWVGGKVWTWSNCAEIHLAGIDLPSGP